MTFLDKMERKFGRFAIKNLTIYILIAYAIGYITYLVNPKLYDFLIMDPELIFKGQVWRIFTWICTMPQDISMFLLFMFTFFYFVGTNLEKTLGSFRYNIFIFSGLFFMTAGALLIYFITYLIGPSSTFGYGITVHINTFYINLTSFLAFAYLYGEHVVLAMLVIPIKMKWLAVLDLILIGYDFLSVRNTFVSALGNNSLALEYTWCYRIIIILSLLNYLLFFIGIRKKKRMFSNVRQVRREVRTETVKIRPVVNVHRCSCCGKTSLEDENLTFRYCSKCNGNFEYCQEHLFTHEHVVDNK